MKRRLGVSFVFVIRHLRRLATNSQDGRTSQRKKERKEEIDEVSREIQRSSQEIPRMRSSRAIHWDQTWLRAADGGDK